MIRKNLQDRIEKRSRRNGLEETKCIITKPLRHGRRLRGLVLRRTDGRALFLT